VSIDYLIGEPECRGRGLGAGMIAAFVAESWAAYPNASAVVVAMHQHNPASWRAVERAGFRRIAEGELTPDNPVDNRDHYLYQLDRPG
jgi:aminoglycoside 6'-N-acetyltransferase